MTPASWRATAAVAALAGAAAAILLVLSVRATPTPFGPGELDLLLTARMMSSGVLPPLWAGSVHPDAIGTWMGALGLSGLLRLGLSDLLALRGFAAAHVALLAASTAGLAARIAGVRAGAAAGAALVVGAPLVINAHTRYLATTVEAASVELLVLWALVEWSRAPRRGAVSVLGVALGLGMAFSLHVAVLAGLAAVVVGRRQVRSLPWLLVPLAAAWLPWLLAPQPLGPPGSPWTVKTLGPGQLLGLVGVDDITALLTHAPFALSGGAAGWLGLALVPLMAALVLALVGSVVATAQRSTPPAVGIVALFAVGAAAPLLLAGDLLGYPAAYRYFVPVLAPCAVLLGVAARRGPALALVLALAAPGLSAVGAVGNTELTRSQAAFYAGQHRLVFPDDALHTHALMLTPWVRDDELSGWLQGYGLHIGREFARQVPGAQIEYRDGFVDEGGVPDPVNRFWRKQQAGHWRDGMRWLGAQANADFLLGVGLGLAEDGVLESLDLDLLNGSQDERLHIAFGVGAALGERAHWIGDGALQTEAPVAWSRAEQQALADGFVTTAGTRVPSPLPGVRGRPQRRLAHPHPFTYADVGVRGRDQVPTGPR